MHFGFTRPALFLAASLIGIISVVTYWLVWSDYTGRPMSDISGLFWESLRTAVPFLLLASLGIKKPLPWVVGLALTLALWGYGLYDTLTYWGSGRGANIGLGLIFLVSPVAISVACLGSAATLGRSTSRKP